MSARVSLWLRLMSLEKFGTQILHLASHFCYFSAKLTLLIVFLPVFVTSRVDLVPILVLTSAFSNQTLDLFWFRIAYGTQPLFSSSFLLVPLVGLGLVERRTWETQHRKCLQMPILIPQLGWELVIPKNRSCQFYTIWFHWKIIHSYELKLLSKFLRIWDGHIQITIAIML